ncbi:plasmid stabilization protein [Pseudaminobacter soli (ex Li et al. 2025)]|uniref:Plasmid stabilization protein n=1 Tax=Pseudaminobacter soli (ex Li et al. 2025) TaxID=1295366 RepID=A0A2P7S5X9_9HYPH|nr:plasmid stabilization protein [Mesorhizobium soli]PSJ57857.1 plasmid stabilization protein [Mesorhizobium soli]
MGDMLIRGIPEPLKREIARAAQEDGKSLSAKAIELLHKGMVAEEDVKPGSGQSAWDALRSVFVAEGAVDDEFSKIMEEIEAERKRDFGRPVEDFE